MFCVVYDFFSFYAYAARSLESHVVLQQHTHSYVGKTSIFNRAVGDWKFSHEISATIAISKPLIIMTSKGALKLWDCGGQERFKNITMAFLKQTDACIIVASLDSFTSFQSAKRWLNDIRNFVRNKQKLPIPVVFVVNKIDLDGSSKFVMTDWKLKMKEIAYDFNIPVFSTSALSNTGIHKMLESVADMEKKMRDKNYVSSQ